MQDLFQKRRSIRKYMRERISNDKIKKILDAARWAPSAHNAQPWSFIVITRSDVKLRLAKAMIKVWEEDMVSDRIDEQIRKELISSSLRKFLEPPVLILACLTMQGMDEYIDRRNEAEHTMAIQSVAASIENLILAARLEGLDSCWFCAPLFCQDTVRETLKIPLGIEPQALIAIGYADEKPASPSRIELKDVSYSNYWGNKH